MEANPNYSSTALKLGEKIRWKKSKYLLAYKPTNDNR